MVRRAFNRHIGKLVEGNKEYYFWWLKYVVHEFTCRSCRQKLRDAVVMDISVPIKSEGKMMPYPSVKKTICIDCAEKLMEGALERIRICKLSGPDSLRLFDDI